MHRRRRTRISSASVAIALCVGTIAHADGDSATKLRRLRRLPTVGPATTQPTGGVKLGLPTEASSSPVATVNPQHPTPATLANHRVPQQQPAVWLQSVTSGSLDKQAAEALDNAYREYSVSAWASAEASAWEALETLAKGMDLDRPRAGSESSFLRDLEVARVAIREARDFAAITDWLDPAQTPALIASHRSSVLDLAESKTISPTQAIDRYFDLARVRLTRLASQRIGAAQSMDLLAAICLGRDRSDWLPTETALCFRRAALGGQPQNTSLATRLGMQLADMGLDREAHALLSNVMTVSPSEEVADTLSAVATRLGHSMTRGNAVAEATATKRVPDVIQLSPKQFAAISPPVNASLASARINRSTTKAPAAEQPSIDATPANVRPEPVAEVNAVGDSGSAKKKSALARWIDKLPKFPKIPKRVW